MMQSNYITENELNTFLIKSPDCSSSIVGNQFSLIHLNCRSIIANFSEITCLLDRANNNFKISALVVTETWLTPETENLYNMDGYNFVAKSRVGKIGGGVGLYVDNCVEFTVIDELTKSTAYIECIFIEVTLQNRGCNIRVWKYPTDLQILMF